jgi:uncharacterized protein YceK
MRAVVLASLLLLGAVGMGCGTAVNLAVGVDDHEGGGSQIFGTGPGARTRIYGGIQGDIVSVGKLVRGERGLVFSLLCFPLLVLVDFPLSLVADTITLPYTIPVDLLYEPPKASSP